jgi:puromycin-sensitive aminopeptidase
LTQQRFAYPSEDTDASPGGTWAIPVHVRNGDVITTALLDTAAPLTVPLAHPDAAVIVNAGGHGFFRVEYGDALRVRVTSTETLKSLDTLERYSLVDDAWAATVAGRMTAVDFLGVLSGFTDEREYGVWQAIAISLGGLSRLVADEALDGFRQRVRTLVGPAFSALGDPANGEPDMTAKLRGLLTRMLGALGNDADVQAACRELFVASQRNERVDAELLSAATTVVAVSGDADDYQRMLDGFTTASTPQDQLRHLYALAEFDDADLIARTCEFAMSDAVKTQNAPFLLRAAIAHRNHGRAAWEFVMANWERANAEFPGNTIVRMVDSVKLLTDRASVEGVHNFFATHPIEQAVQTLEQVLERQRVNAALRERNRDALGVHLMS